MAITLAPANEGDTTTVHKTLAEAETVAREIHPLGVEELVADKGYHSGETLKTLHDGGVRSYLPEPARANGTGKARQSSRSGLTRIEGELAVRAAGSYRRSEAS